MNQRSVHVGAAALDAELRLLEQPADWPRHSAACRVLETLWRSRRASAAKSSAENDLS